MGGSPSQDGTLRALGETVLLGVEGQGDVGVQLGGVWVGAVQFEGSLDGQTYVPVNLTAPTGGTPVASATAQGVWVGSVAGLRLVRVRCSAYTSGLIVVTLHAAESSAGVSPLNVQIGEPTASYIEIIANPNHVISDASGNAGWVHAVGAIRHATPANISDLDGDWEPLQVSDGRLWTSTIVAENYITELAFDGANNPIYLGRATPTSATSAASWQIRKLTYDGANNPTSILFANGSLAFNAIWDNRAALSYS